MARMKALVLALSTAAVLMVSPAFAVQPAQKVLHPLLQLASPFGEKMLDRNLGGGQKTRSQKHRFSEHEWLHSIEPRR